MAIAQPQRSSNPAFQRAAAGGYGVSQDGLETQYGVTERLTYEDVTVHTAGLLVVLAVFAGVGWTISTPENPGPAVAAALVAFGLSWVINLSRKVYPVVVLAYAALEGVFVGAISHSYEDRANGIVAQAAIGTFAIFLVMLGLHRSGRLRATPRMQRVVIGAVLGIVAVSLLDLLLNVFGASGVPLLNSPSPLGILVSLAIVVVGALTFTLDFGYVEAAVAAGAPRQEAWRMGFAFLVSFVWVYLELLRLLDKLRS